MKKKILLIMAFAAFDPLFAQTTYLNWSVLAGGGGHFQADSVRLDATLGQPIVGVMTGGDIVLSAGFWVPGGCFYVAGDCNGNGIFNGIDVTYCVNYLKGIGPAPPDKCDCTATIYPFYGGADANASCLFNGIDITYMVNCLKGIGSCPIPCPDCPPGGLLPKNNDGGKVLTKDALERIRQDYTR
jgi:hypothetical protein